MPAVGKTVPKSGYLVYLLIDPETHEPFYVGMTSNPKQRWFAHHTDPASQVYHKMRDMRARGIKCRVRILADNLGREEAKERELHFIGRYGDVLVNRLGTPRHGHAIRESMLAKWRNKRSINL